MSQPSFPHVGTITEVLETCGLAALFQPRKMPTRSVFVTSSKLSLYFAPCAGRGIHWHGETRFAALPGRKPCDASPCFASLQRKCRSGTHLLGYVRQIERQNSVSNFPGACHSCGWAFRVIRLNDQSLRRKWGLATGTVEILERAARGCLEFGARVRWKVSSTSFSVVRAKKRETLLSLDDLALNKGRLCPL